MHTLIFHYLLFMHIYLSSLFSFICHLPPVIYDVNKRGRRQPLGANNLLEKTISKQVNGRRKQMITGKENKRVS